jgi:hypothetical protein
MKGKENVREKGRRGKNEEREKEKEILGSKKVK